MTEDEPVKRHALTNIDHEASTADCAVCGPNARVRIRARLRQGRSLLSVECTRGVRRGGKPSRYASRHGPRVNRRRLLRSYGLSFDDYDRMLASQKGCCAICGKEMDRLHVDHDHQTGRVRGLLCPRCNTALALFRDDAGVILAAARYLSSDPQNEQTAPAQGDLVTPGQGRA